MARIIQWIRKNKSSMKLVVECFDKVKKDCFKFIRSQETTDDKCKNRERMRTSF